MISVNLTEKNLTVSDKQQLSTTKKPIRDRIKIPYKEPYSQGCQITRLLGIRGIQLCPLQHILGWFIAYKEILDIHNFYCIIMTMWNLTNQTSQCLLKKLMWSYVKIKR